MRAARIKQKNTCAINECICSVWHTFIRSRLFVSLYFGLIFHLFLGDFAAAAFVCHTADVRMKPRGVGATSVGGRWQNGGRDEARVRGTGGRGVAQTWADWESSLFHIICLLLHLCLSVSLLSLPLWLLSLSTSLFQHQSTSSFVSILSSIHHFFHTFAFLICIY